MMAAVSYRKPHSVGLDALRSSNRRPLALCCSRASASRFGFRFQFVRKANIRMSYIRFVGYPIAPLNFSIAGPNPCGLFSTPPNKSPTRSNRRSALAIWNCDGFSPGTTSSHLSGVATGAPGYARST